MTEKKTQKQLDAQKAVIDAMQETISAQERTIVAKTNLLHALTDLRVVLAEPEDKFDLQEQRDFLKKENERLRKAIVDVHNAGLWGIEHVGAANYAEREHEALVRLSEAYKKAVKEG